MYIVQPITLYHFTVTVRHTKVYSRYDIHI